MTSATLRIDPKLAQAERARRELARRHLVDFAEYMGDGWYKAYRHQKMLGEALEEVVQYIETQGREGVGRLIVTMPPRHGKTEEISKMLPAWLLGRSPNSPIMLIAYNGDLAADNSRAARNYVTDPRYEALFGSLSTKDLPVQLSSDSRSVTGWYLAAPHRGGLRAAGIGGGITGRGSVLLVVDDPFKGREDADSAAQRDRVWKWWTSEAYPRFQKGGAVIIVLTRWHPDDLAGRLLQAMASNPNADVWKVLNLQAVWEKPQIPEDKDFETYHHEMLLNGIWVDEEDPLGREEGDALWPEEFDEKALARIRENIGPHDWMSLYQQSPIYREGQMFKPEWFDIVDRVPGKIVTLVRYWDKAGTDGGGDYSVGVMLAKNDAGHYFVLHVVRERLSYFQRNIIIRRTIDADLQREGAVARTYQEVENSAAGKEAAVNVVKEMQGRPIQMDPVGNKSKEVRASAYASACEAGLVHLVRASWNQAFIEEHMMFPKGKNDDQVDATSGAYNKIAQSGRSGVHF